MQDISKGNEVGARARRGGNTSGSISPTPIFKWEMQNCCSNTYKTMAIISQPSAFRLFFSLCFGGAIKTKGNIHLKKTVFWVSGREQEKLGILWLFIPCKLLVSDFNQSPVCSSEEHRNGFIGKCAPEFCISLSLQSGLVNS